MGIFDFQRIDRLPPYVFTIVKQYKDQTEAHGKRVLDFGMGNPDQPPPPHIIDKLVEVTQKPDVHRYSVSHGVDDLRSALCRWYQRKYDVTLDPEQEAIVTIGSKEGLSHLALAIINPGDLVFSPSPAYPIHHYAPIISGGLVHHIPVGPKEDFLDNVKQAFKKASPRPKIIFLNFPHNPTAACVELDFYRDIVEFALEQDILLVNDLAYSEVAFDGYVPPSILQIPGAKDIAVEFYSMSKTYNMPGWRVGFCAGNAKVVAALRRMKSYLDYGMPQPVQIAAAAALNGPQSCVDDIRDLYQKRRDQLCDGLNSVGWAVERPRATMFVWAEIPEEFKAIGSLKFSKYLIEEAGVALSPGIGFGDFGDEYVRISLLGSEVEIAEAVDNIGGALNRRAVAA